MEIGLDLKTIDHLTGGKLGTFDVPCPACGPQRLRPANRRKPVLRIWCIVSGFATYHCARCGERGYARDGSKARAIDQAVIERAGAEATERERIASAERLSKARWLWSKSQPLSDSIAETYLREARGYRDVTDRMLNSGKWTKLLKTNVATGMRARASWGLTGRTGTDVGIQPDTVKPS
jgi:hypothetical protein